MKNVCHGSSDSTATLRSSLLSLLVAIVKWHWSLADMTKQCSIRRWPSLARRLFFLQLAIFVLFSPFVHAQVATTTQEPATDSSGCGGAAMNHEGLKFYRGQGVPKDDGHAVRLFEKAAVDCGNADALANLGDMYQSGAGVPKNIYRAKELYQQSASLGSAEGMAKLAQWYMQAQPSPDYTRARVLFEKAAALGDRSAALSLGDIHYFGTGASRNLKQAIECYERVLDMPPSADEEPGLSGRAAWSIAGIYLPDNSPLHDGALALQWYLKAAALGDARAMARLANLYQHGGAGVEKNPQQAQLWATKAAEAEAKQKPTPAAPRESPCKTADLDPTLNLYDERGEQFSVTEEVRNRSTQPCRLDYASLIFQAEPPSHPGALVKAHVDVCQNCNAAGQRARPGPMVLAPGSVAHVTISWRSTPSSDDSQCVAMGAMYVDFGPMSAGATLFPGAPGIPICSTVNAGWFVPGPDPKARRKGIATLQISAAKNSYFPREHMLLTVTSSHPRTLSGAGQPCPPFLQRIRYPNGRVMYVPLAGGDARCKIGSAGWTHSPGLSLLEVTLLANVYWELGQYELQVLQYAPFGKHRNQWRLVAKSGNFPYSLSSSYKIERTWGPEVKGLAATVTLEKTTYLLGEDVPLHIALKNVSVPDRTFHIQLCTDAVITVRNENGQKIDPTNNQEFCSQNGTYNPYFPPGDLLPAEHSLKLMGLLPHQPGRYTVESIWTMYPKPPGPNGLMSRGEDVGAPYAIVSSAPVTFRVSDPSIAGSDYPAASRPSKFVVPQEETPPRN
jgi:TPR repeat protein